jgi:hypothetical protein
MSRHAAYTHVPTPYVVREHDVPADAKVIRDIGNHARCLTVTNDAEYIVTTLLSAGLMKRKQRLFYFDSDGALDEILHDGVKFTGFAPGPGRRK